MADEDDNEPVYMDMQAARVVAMLQVDAPQLLAQAAAPHAEQIMCSPAVVGLILGVSEKTARKLIDTSALPSAGTGKHRWVPLAALARRRVDVRLGLEDVFEEARERATLAERVCDGPIAEGPFVEDRRRCGVEDLVRSLEARVAQLEAGR